MTLSRAGYAPEQPSGGPRENSPLTPNFVLANSSRTKEERSDFSVTVEQFNLQRSQQTKKALQNARAGSIEGKDAFRQTGTASQPLRPKPLTTQSRENSAHVPGSSKHFDTYTNQATDVMTHSLP